MVKNCDRGLENAASACGLGTSQPATHQHLFGYEQKTYGKVIVLYI